jgi:hypothetical protein
MSVARQTLVAAADLPELVSRYVERNVPVDEPSGAGVRFTQVGEMQPKPGRWRAFRAEQEIAVDRVEFEWRATFRMAPLVSLRLRDWYRAGAGGLDGRLGGIPVVRASGEEVNRGEAIRYLAELPWAPQAIALNSALGWREVDASTVEVSTCVGGARVAVSLRFDDQGDIVAASTDARPRMVGKQIVDTPWRGVFGEYRTFGGVRLPTTAEVSWLLPKGPWTYFRGTVTGWCT